MSSDKRGRGRRRLVEGAPINPATLRSRKSRALAKKFGPERRLRLPKATDKKIIIDVKPNREHPQATITSQAFDDGIAAIMVQIIVDKVGPKPAKKRTN